MISKNCDSLKHFNFRETRATSWKVTLGFPLYFSIYIVPSYTRRRLPSRALLSGPAKRVSTARDKEKKKKSLERVLPHIKVFYFLQLQSRAAINRFFFTTTILYIPTSREIPLFGRRSAELYDRKIFLTPPSLLFSDSWKYVIHYLRASSNVCMYIYAGVSMGGYDVRCGGLRRPFLLIFVSHVHARGRGDAGATFIHPILYIEIEARVRCIIFYLQAYTTTSIDNTYIRTKVADMYSI